MADEYVVVNKTDLTSIADTIRGALGSTDNIPVGDLGSKLIESIEAGGGGGSVEPFTKIISGTITFAEKTAAFQLPETENFLAAYFIRTDFWGVKEDIYDSGAQLALFASGQSFGYFSPIYMSSSLFQLKDILNRSTDKPILSDGKITFGSGVTGFCGTYYYSLIYGTK